MKVKELMEILKEIDPEKEVYLYDSIESKSYEMDKENIDEYKTYILFE